MFAQTTEDISGLQIGLQRGLMGAHCLSTETSSDWDGEARFTATAEGDMEARHQLRMLQEQREHATRRKEDGTYAYCEICGAEIPVDRHRACPEATTCIQCQREIELRVSRCRRSH